MNRKVINIIFEQNANIFYDSNITINSYQLSDVLKYPEKKFYYILIIIPGEIKNKINENKEFLHKEIVEYWRSYKNFNVILINASESESFETIKLIHEWSLVNLLNQQQFHIINNNERLLEYKKILKTDINFYISDLLLPLLSLSFGEGDFVEIKNGDFFMCHNRMSRNHRFALLCLLKRNKILDNVDWTLIYNYTKNTNYKDYYDGIFNENEVVDLLPEINFFHNLELKTSKYENNFSFESFEKNKQHRVYEKDAYKYSYANIITETCFESDEIHITEKSFKPFHFFQFPLILATHQHIKFMKEKYNFDFFDDIINHDYDDEIDNRKRLYKFVEEIKRIDNNKEQFVDFYKNNKNRFIENHRKILKLSKIDKRVEILEKFVTFEKYENLI